MALAVFVDRAGGFPFRRVAFYLDLACQVFLAAIGALSLMLLTGYAGQISLGHAGLLAAGAFTTGILFREIHAPFWVTLPAAAASARCSASFSACRRLRLRGLYLAISTFALYFVVVYLGGEYESTRGFSTGIMIDPPKLGGFALTRQPRAGISSFWLRPRRQSAALRQPAAQPLRSRLARDPRA